MNKPLKALFWRMASLWHKGGGTILCLHRVCSDQEASPIPICRDLEITSSDLDHLLGLLRRSGYRFVSMDTLHSELEGNGKGKPSIAITLDDGYLDNLTQGLPIFEKHAVPFAVYAVPAFLDGVQPWWLTLEAVVCEAKKIILPNSGKELPAKTLNEKRLAHTTLYEEARRQQAGVDLWISQVLALNPLCRDQKRAFMNWEEVKHLASHPLATIGNHTLSHQRLSLCDSEEVHRQLLQGRLRLEAGLGTAIRHLAYPNGSERDLPVGIAAIAKKTGHLTAVTTIPRNVTASDRRYLCELPRKSVPGVPMEDSRLLAYLGGWEERWNRKVRARLASIRQPL